MPQMYVCPVRGCGRLVPVQGRCERHAREWKRKDDARRHAKQQAQGKNSTHWRKLRKVVLARDGERCRVCGRPARSVHLNPRLRGNHFIATPDDCVTLCAKHHGAIDAPRATRAESDDFGFV